jgi:hypothetical protein
MKLKLLIVFILINSCKDSSIYEIDNAKFKLLKTPVTFIDSKIERLSADKDLIMTEFDLDELRETPDYYAGLIPKYPMITGYFINKFDKSFITQDGGIIYACRCLVINKNGKFILIDSQEKIKEYFAPIQSKEEAISYLSLSTHSYPIYDFKFVKENFEFKKTILNKTYVDSLTDGYKVHLFEKLVFGCEHPYFEVVYELKQDGTFIEKSRKEIFRDPKENGLCID